MLAPFVRVPQKHDFVTPNFYFCHSKLSHQLSPQTHFCPLFGPLLSRLLLALLAPIPSHFWSHTHPHHSLVISHPFNGILMPS